MNRDINCRGCFRLGTACCACFRCCQQLAHLLAWMIDDEPCRYDHHGYCQTHNLQSRPCSQELAKHYRTTFQQNTGIKLTETLR